MSLNVLLLTVFLFVVEFMATHDVKLQLPRKTPTVCAIVICSMWNLAIAVDMLIAQIDDTVVSNS